MTKVGGINSQWICDDDGDIGQFPNELIDAKCQAKDYSFFENDYVRFIARVEGLALGFVKGMVPETPSASSPIDFGLIHRVCLVVQDMPAESKSRMFENLRAYRDVEFDRMTNIISKE